MYSSAISQLKLFGPRALLTASLLFSASSGGAQTPPQPQSPSGPDQTEVLRVYTELVQTDVMVFDRQGNFVNDLKREDFELRIDGKPRPVEFFEKVTAGSASEEAQLAAARGAHANPSNGRAGNPAPLDRGRPIFFYVDDLHLELPGLTATKKLITRFIDLEMGQNDEAAIASASGQIGFLQQLTDNKSVLRAALERMKLRPYTVRDSERPVMTEYQALLITQNDRDTTSYFVDETRRQFPGLTPESAQAMVEARARTLAQQGGRVTTNTLSGLEGLIKSASTLPGRKTVFFVSGGFLLDDLNSDSRYRLQRITSAAARSGTVIYSLDARGLVVGLSDASSEGQFDLGGRLSRSTMGEVSATQDGMNALAVDTGGRATFNTNSLEPGLKRALKDSSVYYLLAWKPDPASEQSSKFHRLEVKLVGRQNLNVQVRRGFFDREPDVANAKAAKPKPGKPAANEAEKTPAAEVRKVMLGPYPVRDIPVSLSLSYLSMPTRGSLLTTALQVPREFFSFQPVDGKLAASVTVAGTVFDDHGNPGATFNDHVTIAAAPTGEPVPAPDLKYGYPLYLGPGLYQVRVGVRDEHSGRAGSAHGWIEIPNLAAKELALSSLRLGVRTPSTLSNASASGEPPVNSVDLSISHRFNPTDFLRFVVFVYNAMLSAPDAKPDVVVQIQVVRDGQPVVTTVQRKISTEGVDDLARLPYAAEVSLRGLPAGQYLLQVTVVDRIAKRSASQQTRFEIQ
jgi:VWFA-related protein